MPHAAALDPASGPRQAALPLCPTRLFRLVDDGAGGPLQTFKRRLKFHLRFHRHRRALESVHATLAAQQLDALLQVDPTLLLRPVRSYLWNSLGGSERARALQFHLDWASRRWGPEGVRRFYADHPPTVACWPDTGLALRLRPSHGLGREGEFTLELHDAQSSVMHTVFSLVPGDLLGQTAGRPVMVIGNLQGTRDAAERLREVSQRAERLRPHSLLVAALQGLACGWGIDTLLGVSSRRHAYAGYRGLSRRVGMDYDTLWQEHGATDRVTDSHWHLPPAPAWNPDSVPSRKRAAGRRRHAVRQAWHDAAAQWTAHPAQAAVVMPSLSSNARSRSDCGLAVVSSLSP